MCDTVSCERSLWFRGWGLVVTKPDVGFEGWDEDVSKWENVVEDTVVAKESEYAQY
jgi:hypothetical protein